LSLLTAMFARRFFRRIAAGLTLLSSFAGCTLTSEPYEPEELGQTLNPNANAGAPGDVTGEPSGGACNPESQLVGCEIELAPPGTACASDLDCESLACVGGSCAIATCDDGRRNGREPGVDCGATCPRACSMGACESDGDCESGRCAGALCQPANCDDGVANQGEAGVDCAGPCAARCDVGDACSQASDCADGLFCPEATRRCTIVSCQDQIQNEGEVATDCGGGSCPGCPPGTPCTANTDCATGVCGEDGVCATATCTDGVKNQSETAADCGAACPGCTTGQACESSVDCQSGVCRSGGCDPGVERCCQAPSCDDGVQNGGEPSIDCGNAGCGLCPLNNPCTQNGQCASGACVGGSCQLGPCADGVTNGSETDTDCGGENPACERCAPGDTCARNQDCASGSCLDGQCAACADGVRNGNETDRDCGGSCGACEPGEECNIDTDCQSGACQDGRCCGGVLVDCTRCARRLAGALTCNANGPGAAPNCEAFLDCLADNPDVCPIRYSPGCSDDPGGVCNHTNFGGNTGPGVALADAILGTASCFF
jgi:hypothetical protein